MPTKRTILPIKPVLVVAALAILAFLFFALIPRQVSQPSFLLGSAPQQDLSQWPTWLAFCWVLASLLLSSFALWYTCIRRHARTQHATIISILAVLPSTFLIGLNTISLYAMAILRTRPSPGNPDPKQIGVSLGLLGLIWAILTFYFICASYRAYRRERGSHNELSSDTIGIVVSASLWALCLLVWKYDPGALLVWLAD